MIKHPLETPPEFVVPPASERERLLRILDNRDKVMRVFEVVVLAVVVGVTLFSLLRLNQMATSNESNIVDHRNQIEDAITNSNESANILLCTTSIPPGIKSQAEIDKCYPGGSQAEYFKK